MLSFSAPESDFAAHDLLASYTQVAAGSSKASEVSLPRSFREALLMDDAGHRGHRRDSVVSAAAAPAIVVTTAEAPHRIVHVNRAWEDLCGYSRQEVLDGTLSVLQGPKTNAELADGAVSHLLATRRPVDMYQVNYKKSGEEFVNHVTMGPLPLSEESPDVEFLVAVLRQVLPGQVPLRMAAY
jgi:PAS domain S-box-containing protein